MAVNAHACDDNSSSRTFPLDKVKISCLPEPLTKEAKRYYEQFRRRPALCDASKIAEDWVVKGCHIHIQGVELRMFPDHRGKPEFRRIFESTPKKQIEEAIRVAKNICLPDEGTRKKWITRLRMARTFMMNRNEGITELARGRMFEFRMLEIAIERWEQRQ